MKSQLKAILRRGERLTEPHVFALQASLNRLVIGLGLGFDVQARTLPQNYRRHLIFVRTADLDRRIKAKHWNDRGRRGFVLKGDWDVRLSIPATTATSAAMTTVQQLFVEGLPFRQCAQYLRMKECLEGGRPFNTRGCSTLEDLDRYFEKLIQVYESIRDQGYKTQWELGLSDEDEMRIYIDRNGKPIKYINANHRTEMARILGIKAVPAVVEGVHYLWARKCFEMYGGNLHAAIEQGLRTLDARPEVTAKGKHGAIVT